MFRDFQRGTCTRGKACPYRHSRSPDRKAKPYQKDRGRSPTRSKSPKKDLPCFSFQRTGTCRFGAKCDYKHDKQRYSAAAIIVDDSNSDSDASDPHALVSSPRSLTSNHRDLADPTRMHEETRSTSSNATPAKRGPQRRIRFNDKPEIFKVKVRTRMWRYESSPHDPNYEHARDVRGFTIEHYEEKALKKPHLLAKAVHGMRYKKLQEQQSRNTPRPYQENNKQEHKSSAAATPKSPASVRWLIDTGSAHDLISQDDADVFAPAWEDYKETASDIHLRTANGNITAGGYVNLRVKHLDTTASPLVLSETPPVLSVGRLCDLKGFTFVWPAGKRPYLVKPNKTKIHLDVRHHVPFLDDSVKLSDDDTYDAGLPSAQRGPPDVDDDEVGPPNSDETTPRDNAQHFDLTLGDDEEEAQPPIPFTWDDEEPGAIPDDSETDQHDTDDPADDDTDPEHTDQDALLPDNDNARQEATSLKHMLTHQPRTASVRLASRRR